VTFGHDTSSFVLRLKEQPPDVESSCKDGRTALSTDGMFQDLPQLRETADDTERYI
jgi:hypothetical protein